MTLTNYQPDTNPFQLAGPPKWFLKQLWDFDDSLVIMPSRQGFYYRLAQRRPLNLKENIVNDVLFNESDTKMLASHSLVPVTTILSTANWSNPLLFEELRQRAPWRMGGADKVNAMLEDQDRQKIREKMAKTDSQLTDLSKDAWKYYQLKRGMRTSLFSHAAKGEKSVPGTLLQVNPPQPYKPVIQTSWGNPNT